MANANPEDVVPPQWRTIILYFDPDTYFALTGQRLTPEIMDKIGH